ncbi:hypothetical protein C8J57DRAFT_1554187 [Mycena rebaudengoi]|nr:hypothetical protein C8J57DRAFT_1554187 [Mycena rebaudengoi]
MCGSLHMMIPYPTPQNRTPWQLFSQKTGSWWVTTLVQPAVPPSSPPRLRPRRLLQYLGLSPARPLSHLGRRPRSRTSPSTVYAPTDLGDPAPCAPCDVLHLPPMALRPTLACVAYTANRMPCVRVPSAHVLLVLIGAGRGRGQTIRESNSKVLNYGAVRIRDAGKMLVEWVAQVEKIEHARDG